MANRDLGVTTSVDLANLQRGMQDAAGIVDNQAQKMAASFRRIAEAELAAARMSAEASKARAAALEAGPTWAQQEGALKKYSAALQHSAAASDEVKRARQALNNEEKHGHENLVASIVKAELFVGAFNKVVSVVKEYTVEAAKYAARTETLMVISGQLSKVNHLSADAVRYQTNEIKKLGITTQEASGAINKMIFAQLDLKKSGELARMSQDAAAIAGVNSSDAFAGILHGIITRQTDVLRTYGIVVDFETAYKRAVEERRHALTNAEKTQVAMQEVLKQGTKISGAYEAAMLTAGKQLTSLSRYTDEAKNAIGEGLVPALSRAVSLLATVSKYAQENGESFSKMAVGVTAVGAGVAAFKMMPGPWQAKLGAGAIAAGATYFGLTPDVLKQTQEQGEEAIQSLIQRRGQINEKLKTVTGKAEAEALKSQYEAAGQGIDTVKGVVADRLAKIYIERNKGIIFGAEKEAQGMNLGEGVSVSRGSVLEAIDKRKYPEKYKSGALFDQAAYDKAIKDEQDRIKAEYRIPIAEKRLKREEQRDLLTAELGGIGKPSTRMGATLEAETQALLAAEDKRYEIERAAARRMNALKREQAEKEGKPADSADIEDLEKLRLEHLKKRATVIQHQKEQEKAANDAAAAAQLAADQQVAEKQVAQTVSAAKSQLEARWASVEEQTKAAIEAENDEYEVRRKGLEDQLRLAREYPEKNRNEIIKLHGELRAEEIAHQTKINEIRADGDIRGLEFTREMDARYEQEKLAHTMRVLALERARLHQRNSGGELSEKGMRAAEAGLARREYDAEMRAASAEFGAAKKKGDPAGIAAAQARIQEIADRYATTLESMKNNTHRIINGITDEFNRGISSWISGQQSLSSALGSIWNNLATQFAMAMLMMAEKRLLAHLLHKSIAKKDIAADAWGSASKAYHSVMTALPFPANVIVAPITAAAVFAGNMAFASFSRGGIMPESGMAELHKNEMVLDPKLSAVVQRAATGGGGSTGGQREVHYHAAPGESPDSIRRNKQTLYKVIREGFRDGQLVMG